MVFDGKPGKSYREISMIVGTHGFSPDGAHYAYVGDGRVVLDGVEQVVPEIGPGKIWKLIFSPDGKPLAYIGEWNLTPMIVVDGAVVEKSRDQVKEGASFAFSPDSKHSNSLCRGPYSWMARKGEAVSRPSRAADEPGPTVGIRLLSRGLGPASG